ncbi:MAG: ABC transporter permease [Bacteroidaceae bacterium]|nr:ABC transporter permease [Bacteroidaceae bacterium]
MAFRQLVKYKFHTIVSALCMAVGLTINGYIGNMVRCQFLVTEQVDFVKKTDEYITGAEYKQMVASGIEGVHGFHSHNILCEWLWGYTDNVEQLYEISATGVSPEFFRYYVDPRGSLMISGRDSIGENEVIVCDELATLIFGDRNPIGESLTMLRDTVMPTRYDFYSGKTYRIVGVCKKRSNGNFRYEVYLPIADGDRCECVRAFRKDGYSCNDIQRVVDDITWRASKDAAPYEVTVKNRYNYDTEFWLSMVLFTTFSLLIFATGLINFMKFMIQMFYSRQRELALRKCLGSGNRGLYLLLACEVLIMLAVSFLLSCITTELSYIYMGYLNINIVELTLPMLITMQLQTTLIALAVALVVILVPILKLRRTGMRGSLLRHTPGTKMRNFMVGLQFFVAIVCFGFLGVTLKMESAERGRLEDYMSDEELNRILVPSKWVKNWDDIRPLLEKLPIVEAYTYTEWETRRKQSYNYEKLYVGSDSIYADVIAYGGDASYFTMFNIPMEGKVVSPDEEGYVYIDKKLHKSLLERGNYDGTIMRTGGRTCRVAGVLDRSFTYDGQTVFADHHGEVPFSGSIFFVNKGDYNMYYYRIKDGVSLDEARKAFKDVHYKFMSSTFDVQIETLKESLDELNAFGRMMKSLAYIMAFISMLVVIMSIYSTISLDATTKQKEIAVRKINGARGWDILRRFVVPYAIIFTVTFLVIYPLIAIIYWRVAGAYSDFMSVGFVIGYGVAMYVGILLLLALVTWHRIRMIMSVNPADVIRRE